MVDFYGFDLGKYIPVSGILGEMRWFILDVNLEREKVISNNHVFSNWLYQNVYLSKIDSSH